MRPNSHSHAPRRGSPRSHSRSALLALVAFLALTLPAGAQTDAVASGKDASRAYDPYAASDDGPSPIWFGLVAAPLVIGVLGFRRRSAPGDRSTRP